MKSCLPTKTPVAATLADILRVRTRGPAVDDVETNVPGEFKLCKSPAVVNFRTLLVSPCWFPCHGGNNDTIFRYNMIYPYSVHLGAVASPGWYTTFLRSGRIPYEEVLLASRSKVTVPSWTSTLPYVS